MYSQGRPIATSMSREREYHTPSEYLQLAKSLSNSRDYRTKVSYEDDSDHDIRSSARRDYRSKREKSSIASLKSQIHNIKSQVSEIIGRKSTDAKKSKEMKEMSDKNSNSNFRSEVGSVSIDQRVNSRVRRNQFGSQEDELTYFKIEYEILMDEYNSLRRKYRLQKVDHQDRVMSLQKKTKFLEISLREKENEVFQCQQQIEAQLLSIREHLALKTKNSCNIESSQGDYKRIIQEQNQSINELTSQLEISMGREQELRVQLEESARLKEEKETMIHQLRISNGSLTQRMEEVELTRHRFEQLRQYQESMRKEEVGKMEWLSQEIDRRQQIIRSLRSNLQTVNTKMETQEREDQPQEELAEAQRKGTQLQLQLDSMMLVVEKLENKKGELDSKVQTLTSEAMTHCREKEQLEQKVRRLEEAKADFEHSSQQNDSPLSHPPPSSLILGNTEERQKCEENNLINCYRSSREQYSQLLQKYELLMSEYNLAVHTNTTLREKVSSLLQKNEGLSKGYSDRLMDLLNKDPSSSNNQVINELCNKIRDVTSQFVESMKEAEDLRTNLADTKEQLLKSKNQDVLATRKELEECKQKLQDHDKLASIYSEKIHNLQQITKKNEEVILEYITPQTAEMPELMTVLRNISDLSFVTNIRKEALEIKKLKKENELLYSDVLFLRDQAQRQQTTQMPSSSSQPKPEQQ